MRKVLPVLALAMLQIGCAVNLPFNNKPSFEQVTEARKMRGRVSGLIAIQWVPPDFPQRIDIKGASGFVGGGSATRIPTGIALANRITEILDTAIGIDPTSAKILVIQIESASSRFTYAGLINVTPTIDWAEVKVTAHFSFGAVTWSESFASTYDDPTIGGTSQTGELEKAWDDIAIAVAKSVVEHIGISL